eukprot:1159833-Prorocentrum_minimum.AAC.1
MVDATPGMARLLNRMFRDRYRPAHVHMLNYQAEGGSGKGDPPNYFKHLTETGTAFVPKTNSQCRNIGEPA